jgi:Uma2 family endonuclease
LAVPPVVIQRAEQEYHLPATFEDRRAFLHWVESTGSHRPARFDYCAGELWVAFDEEDRHVRLQQAFEDYLEFTLSGRGPSGRFFTGGCRIHPDCSALSAAPDGAFVLTERLQARTVSLSDRGGDRFWIEGSADMVLEIVSAGSARRDTVRLRELYWQAGISEYWLVDAREKRSRLEILRSTVRGYVAGRKQDGWVRSAVFGKSFRLIQETDVRGHPAFRLEVR